MITDARSIPANAELKCDLCIVGAGAAGITLALQFVESKLRVIVLESGGEKLEAEQHIRPAATARKHRPLRRPAVRQIRDFSRATPSFRYEPGDTFSP